MKNIEWKLRIDGFLKFTIPALLSLIIGMLNTYHSQAVIDRQELLKTVQSATVTNARQDEAIAYLKEIVIDIRENKSNP
jgi:hypothetical protein